MNQTQGATTDQAPAIFAQLVKVDEEKRLVFGRAVQEMKDRVGEIFDYETSVPFFKAWSKSQEEASAGKSFGNLRSMHKDVVAGILTGITFQDDEKAIDIVGKVIDDGQWKMVLEGGFTGFSIGGRYVKKWEDPEQGCTRYTADPTEISLVDRPAVPTSTFFEVQKKDGSIEKHSFQRTVRTEQGAYLVSKGAKVEEIAALSDEELDKKYTAAMEEEQDGPIIEINATAEQVDEFVKALAIAAVPLTEATKLIKIYGEQKVAQEPTLEAIEKKGAELAAAAGKEGCMKDSPEGKEFLKQAESILRKEKEPKIEEVKKYGNVKFADEKNKKYPIDTEPQIRTAWSYISKAKSIARYAQDEIKLIKDKIAAAWKERITKDELPMVSEEDGKKDMTPSELRKNLIACGDFAYLLDSLCNLQERVEYEAVAEADASDLGKRMKDCMLELGTILSEMVTEEIQEEYAGDETKLSGNVPMLAMRDGVKGLMKRATEIAKYGARNSAKDTEVLQKMHDHTVALGAKCMKTAVAKSDEGALVTENIDLKKSVTELTATAEQLKKDVEMLKAQPMPSKARLRVIGKGEDLGMELEGTKTEPVKDRSGEVNKVASSIKEIHATGGRPLLEK